MHALSAFRTATTLLTRTNARTTATRLCLKPTIPMIYAAQTRSMSANPTRKKIGLGKKKNSKIPYEIVRVRNEDDSLSEPRPLKDILGKTDLELYVVELVTEVPFPIVRVVDKKEHLLRIQNAKAAAKKTKVEEKELQLTWGMASGDIAHKIAKVREELKKGNRVTLVFGPKPRQNWSLLPSWDELLNQVEETVKGLSDVATEWRERRVEGKVVASFLQCLKRPAKAKNEAPLNTRALQKLDKLKEKKEKKDKELKKEETDHI